MEDADIETTVNLLAASAKGGGRIQALPPAGKPSSVAEALAMQERLLARLGKPVRGWKVAKHASGEAMWGAILAADCLPTPAEIEGHRFEPMGVEGEIAFRFDRDLPSRVEPYSRSEIEALMTAFPAIEIVSSRFASYQDTPVFDRLVDRMSNGALIMGEPRADWRSFDLVNLRVTLTRDGEQMRDGIGGHSSGDPFLPAIDFIHAVQKDRSFRTGEIITTGTFTGLVFGKPGETYAVDFHGFGRVVVTFR